MVSNEHCPFLHRPHSAVALPQQDGILSDKQHVFDAPWQILAEDLERPEVQEALGRRQKRAGRPCRNSQDDRTLPISGI